MFAEGVHLCKPRVYVLGVMHQLMKYDRPVFKVRRSLQRFVYEQAEVRVIDRSNVTPASHARSCTSALGRT